MAKIITIRSGAQSGVDRAALETAKVYGIKICGWCPKGGWAEDYPEPPGVLALYPELQETFQRNLSRERFGTCGIRMRQ